MQACRNAGSQHAMSVKHEKGAGKVAFGSLGNLSQECEAENAGVVVVGEMEIQCITADDRDMPE